MTPNRIKIACNGDLGTLSYLIQNEQGAWVPVSRYSELSQRKYTATTIRESANAILRVIDSVYNPAGRGVEIAFEGPDRDSALLREEISRNFASRGIVCERKTVKAALAGKRASGKTTLIGALCRLLKEQFTETRYEGHIRYAGDSGTLEWYELAGIDMGENDVSRAAETVDALAGEGLTHFIYCFGGTKVEPQEAELIDSVREKHPEIAVLSVRTRAVSEDDVSSAELIGEHIGTGVIPVLAEDLVTRAGTVAAYGCEDVLNAIFNK